MSARAILHVDMDAFFASVEVLDDPSLVGLPVVVGGPSKRGVVAAASYEARKYGVRSAMPMVQALRLCPHATVLPGRHGRYAEVSREVFAIFERYTPLVEGLSVDEAFLDVTASRGLFGDGPTIARRIKDDIRRELGLTASAGVAASKFAAKIASDLDKPDGLVVVPDDVEAFLAPLGVERMWGVGPKAAERLRAAGVRTIGDLARASPRTLASILGEAWSAHVADLARGVDPRSVDPGREAISVGAEETFERDLVGRAELEPQLLAQAERVAKRLLRAGLWGTTITVKLKYADFTVRSRQTRLPEPVFDTRSIHAAACGLLDRFDLRRPVRLTGVSVSQLTASPPAKLFPDEQLRKRERLERAVLDVEDRFGGVVKRATLLERGGEDTAGARGKRERR